MNSEEESKLVGYVSSISFWFALLSNIVGFFSFVYQLRKISGGYSKRYNIYLIILKYLAFQLSVIATYHIVNRTLDDSITLITRLYYFSQNWTTFFLYLGLMLCDLEMLKLLYVITPFFTPKRITVIQILECILCFGMSFGMLYYPFSNFGRMALLLYKISAGIHVALFVTVVSQCIYVTYKMHQFSQRKQSQEASQSKTELQRAIAYILTFMCINIFAFVLLILAVIGPWPTSRIVNIDISNRVLDIALCMMPYQLIVYSKIFDAIKGIKFHTKMSSSVKNTR
ncbi:hypothetical protein BC833DRAFT_606675 [Globomyces pollinis-pini]|nr:hypothetical protein BC833DRAFT_606675 [Globomyces pollinis-pini]